jgi:hypothetical protein
MVKEIIEGWKNNAIPNKQVDAVAIERAKICSECDKPKLLPKFIFNSITRKLEDTGMSEYKCSECGCPLAAKCRSLQSQCPLDKWFKINYMQAISFLSQIEAIRNELLIGRAKLSAHYTSISKEINDLFETPVMKIQKIYEEVSFSAFGESGGAVKQEYKDLTSVTGKITASIHATVTEQVTNRVLAEISKLTYETFGKKIILGTDAKPLDIDFDSIQSEIDSVKDWVKDLGNSFDFNQEKDSFDEFDEKLNESGGELLGPLMGGEPKTDETPEPPVIIDVEEDSTSDEPESELPVGEPGPVNAPDTEASNTESANAENTEASAEQ